MGLCRGYIVQTWVILGLAFRIYRFWSAGNAGMEKRMDTTIMGYIGFRVWDWGFRRNGKEHGNYYNGLYRD